MAEVKLEGNTVLTAQLLAIPDKVRNAVQKDALQQANAVILSELKKETPVYTGRLQKSLTTKVKTYQSGRISVGIVGAKQGYEAGGKPYRHRINIKAKYRSTETQPTPYNHLVVLGTVERKTSDGKRRGKVTPNDFYEKTLSACKQQVERILENAVKAAFN